MTIEIKFHGTKPEKGRQQDAAFDLRAAEKGYVPPNTRKLVRSGTQIVVPEGAVALVCSRSGLALKHGVSVANSPGIVDPGYIGDVGVILENNGRETFFYDKGDRIAQLLVLEVPEVTFKEAKKALPQSERGEQGFGSSGVA